MSIQAEAHLEKKLIEQLVTLGYSHNKSITDYESLLKNFRIHINNHNLEALKGELLTDAEFHRILVNIENKSIIESAKILRDKFVLLRDDGSTINIEFMNTSKWCKNKYEVISQLKMKGTKNQRYDVTLLINGLPLIHIELKKQGKDERKAFEQIKNYRNDSMNKLLNFTQLFVISNGEISKYFSNNIELNYNFTFFWTDRNNKKISHLSDFAKSFLDKCHISEMIARYMIIQEKQRNILVLRPYQVYAVKSIIDRVKETNNNGFIWHTTGSGKTLTSFKASQILLYDEEVNARKIIFLVDRKDLDKQTADEFMAFGGDNFFDRTNSTKVLVNKLNSTRMEDKLIITTIQKMDRLIKNDKNAKILEGYKKDKVIFIIDECHRSQYGKMHAGIRRIFSNSQYIGFTGTPLLEEVQTVGEKLTADNFEKCLHKYLIKDAIADKNVLGFNVDYYSVNEVENKEENLYNNPKRLVEIAKCILDKHNNLTHRRKNCALFTVPNITTLIEYYKILKELNIDYNYKISAIFSLNSASDQDGEKLQVHEQGFDMIIKDYNKMYDKEYTKESYSMFFEDICKKIKSADIDIVIVVDMLLTGFDSKKLNTLYVDKNLKHHNLLQAYSRTNRVDVATKEHGNIICFRDLKEDTDIAIKMFSNSDSLEDIVIKKYTDQKEEVKQYVKDINSFGSLDSIRAIQSETEKLNFVKSMKKLIKKVNTMETFTEFDMMDIDIDIQGVYETDDFISLYDDYEEPLKTAKAREYRLAQLESIYLHIAGEVKKIKDDETDKESVLKEFEFELEFIENNKINVDYILNLLDKGFNSEEARYNPILRSSNIIDIKSKLENIEVSNKELLEQYIDTELMKEVNNHEEINITDGYKRFLSNKQKEEIEIFAKDNDYDINLLEEAIAEYEFKQELKAMNGYYTMLIKPKNLKFKDKITERSKIKDFLINIIDKYIQE